MQFAQLILVDEGFELLAKPDNIRSVPVLRSVSVVQHSQLVELHVQFLTFRVLLLLHHIVHFPN